jgi:hypothetical protein
VWRGGQLADAGVLDGYGTCRTARAQPDGEA